MPEKLDKTKITEELELLQLEEARAQAQERRDRKNQSANRRHMVQASLRDTDKRRKYTQSRCAHRKGGKGYQELYSGNDHNFAVIKHILSHGPLIVICQRCGRLWEPPDKALNSRKAEPEDRKEYKRLWDEYQWAINLPTDNETSGTKLFEFHNEDAA